MKITITVEAELENEWDADQARADLVEAIDRVAPYMFDNVIVTSNIEPIVQEVK